MGMTGAFWFPSRAAARWPSKGSSKRVIIEVRIAGGGGRLRMAQQSAVYRQTQPTAGATARPATSRRPARRRFLPAQHCRKLARPKSDCPVWVRFFLALSAQGLSCLWSRLHWQRLESSRSIPRRTKHTEPIDPPRSIPLSLSPRRRRCTAASRQMVMDVNGNGC
jgi:hypothetical protein